MLAWTIYVSFLGAAALMLLPKKNAPLARGVALMTAIVGLIIALSGLAGQRTGELITVAQYTWIPTLGIQYHLAADGISLVLVLLTGIVAVAEFCFRGTSNIARMSSSRSSSR